MFFVHSQKNVKHFQVRIDKENICSAKMKKCFWFSFLGKPSHHWGLNAPGSPEEVEHPDLRLDRAEQALGRDRLHHRSVHGGPLRPVRLQLPQPRSTSVSRSIIHFVRQNFLMNICWQKCFSVIINNVWSHSNKPIINDARKTSHLR